MKRPSSDDLGLSSNRLFANVAPFEDGWCVVCASGYYAEPLDRDTALTRALALAAEHAEPAVGILDIHRECVDFVPVLDRAGACRACGAQRCGQFRRN